MLDFRAYGNDAFFYCVYERRNKSKAEYVDYQENRVIYFRVYIGKNRKSAIVIRAYIEHIERIVHAVCEEYVVHDYVHYKCHERQHGENYHAPSEKALVEAVAVVRHEENAYYKLKAVMHHCLDIDADQLNINVAGVYHNGEPRKKRESSHIRYYGVANLAFFCKYEYGEQIHRRGAELEGEGVPLVIPRCRNAVAFHRENNLLVNLKKNDDDPENEQYPAERFVAAILEFPYHKSRKQNRESERNQVPCAEKHRSFHFRAEKIYYFFKNIHLHYLIDVFIKLYHM